MENCIFCVVFPNPTNENKFATRFVMPHCITEISDTDQTAEPVIRKCSIKWLFLKISQTSQENTCAVVSFLIKLHAGGCFAEHIRKFASERKH